MSSADDVRDGYRYTKDHEWLSGPGAERQVGITAYAVDQLGDITLVNLDVKAGDRLTAGTSFGTVESVKTLSDLNSPVSGTVVRVNDALDTQPELVNEDPYGKAWILTIEVEGDGDAGLMDAAGYKAFLAKIPH